MTSQGAGGGTSDTTGGGCAIDGGTDDGVTIANGENVEGPLTARLQLPPVVHSGSEWKLGHGDGTTPAGSPPITPHLDTAEEHPNEGGLSK